MVARPALIIYSFAPKVLPSDQNECARAHDYLKTLWDGCDALGISEAVPGLNVSTAFPEIIDNSHLFRILAAKVNLARRANHEDYQAFLFEYQDILGLLATLETNVRGEHICEWKALLEQWISAAGAVEIPRGMMEETYLFTALHEGNNSSSVTWMSDDHFVSSVVSSLGKDIIQAMPGNNGTPWRSMSPYVSNNGYCIWGGEQIYGRRAVALIAPEEKKDDLFSWTVWPSPHVLAPFARYLMHGAKLDFAYRVFESEIPKLQEASRRLDVALRELLSLLQDAADTGLWSSDEIAKAHAAVTAEQMKDLGLLYGISRLRELSLTTKVAARNMRELVPPRYAGIVADNNDLFQRYRTRSVWLREQIEMDRGYLAALRERASKGHQVATVLLRQKTENNSRRLKNLVLVQGTLIGSLAIGLSAYEAFHSHALVWAIIALLMAIALAFPTLFERWCERYTTLDRIAGGVLGAATFFFVTTVWTKISQHVSWWPVTKASSTFSYALFNITISLIGFLLAYFGVGLLEGLKRRRVQH